MNWFSGRPRGFELVGTQEMDHDEEEDEMMDEEAGDDFRERVSWQSKYETSTCFGCGSTFNPITNRHHHCRACGRVVCGSCSEHKDKVRGYAKPQRTCDECHERLANEVDFTRILALVCPCLKLVKREIRKAQSTQAPLGRRGIREEEKRIEITGLKADRTPRGNRSCFQ